MGFRLCMAGFHAHDRKEWHAYITRFSEYTVQGSLIDFLVWMKLHVVARRPFH